LDIQKIQWLLLFDIHKGNGFNYGNKKVADAFKLLFVSFGGYEENVYFIFQARGNPVKIYTFQIKEFLTLTWRRVYFGKVF